MRINDEWDIRVWLVIALVAIATFGFLAWIGAR